MQKLKCLVCVLLGVGLLSRSALADLKEVEKGVFVDDFDDGKIDQLGVSEGIAKRNDPKLMPRAKKARTDGGRKVFYLKGGFQNCVFYHGKTFKDFTLEAVIKKTRGSYGGIVVRDKWRVYFQMKCFLSLNAASGTKGVRGGELWKSSERFKGYHKLRIVCVGPMMHVYIDGQSMFRHRIADEAGRIGFYAHGNGEVFCDSIRIEEKVDPLEALAVEPQAPDDALVFSPDDKVGLQFKVSNYLNTAQPIMLQAAVKTWDGKVIKDGGQQQVQVGAAGSSVVTFDMGQLPAGFHCIHLQASCQGKPICSKDDLPLAIQKPWAGTFKAPLIPLAPYSKYMCEKSPLYMHTYAHAIARSLREHNLNAIVADPMLFTDQKIFDIFHTNGIAVITRSASSIDHPGVIGALVYDEPKMEEMEKLKSQYAKLRAQTDKPFTTCMVGEGTGLGGTVPKWEILASTKPGVRCFRWYGVKKSYYDALYNLKYKGNLLPLPDLLRVVEATDATPYWFVIPSFGGTGHEAYFQDPSPAQLKCMMHLAMAYGAGGLLFYTLHRERDAWEALVEQKSLQACDGKYEACAGVAAQINAHAALLKSLKHGRLDVRCSSPYIEVVPRQSAGKCFIYVVNKNAKQPVTVRLLVPSRAWTWTEAQDVFAGKTLAVTQAPKGDLALSLELGPGDGALIATNAAPRK